MYLMLISNKCTRFSSQITTRTTFSCKTQVLNYFSALSTSNKTLWVVFWLVCGTIRDWLVPNWSQKVSWHQDIFFQDWTRISAKTILNVFCQKWEWRKATRNSCFAGTSDSGSYLGQKTGTFIWDQHKVHRFQHPTYKLDNHTLKKNEPHNTCS